ncbi:hypothetical protein HDV63DRAFT_138796 [Trichoderma sp. SZMC 28014]
MHSICSSIASLSLGLPPTPLSPYICVCILFDRSAARSLPHEVLVGRCSQFDSLTVLVCDSFTLLPPVYDSILQLVYASCGSMHSICLLFRSSCTTFKTALAARFHRSALASSHTSIPVYMFMYIIRSIGRPLVAPRGARSLVLVARCSQFVS